MLSKSIMHNHTGKWSLALTEFSLTFTPLKSIKGQIVVDFLANHNFQEVQGCNFIEIKPWILYIDGLNHADDFGVGVVIISPEKFANKVFIEDKTLCSNNEAKFETLSAC